MGVYIKGVEMPLACSNCAFCEESYFYAGAYCRISEDDDMMSINETRSKRRDNCPLGLVPPHGDLIDRDAYEYPGDLVDEPVIIPAEEGE